MSNRLARESSPYLKQHADNPVDWYPWGPDALAAARDAHKPILLSIGYASCHWCHVMAHESFEDPDTARVMNEHFVNVKIDREERPDLDKIYQLAQHLLTQQTGGWPLTMFLDPDTLVPFFGGTYFPKSPRYQLPGFVDLLLRIHEAFETQREALTEQSEKLTALMDRISAPDDSTSTLSDEDLLAAARDGLAAQYDPAAGGFGKAPKFPMPQAVERLLRHWAFRARAGKREREVLDMVMTSLTRMARGGIFDHVGGGFCRYSVDDRWMIPHFEKMLYDNGQLLALYSDAMGVGPDPLFEGAVTETAEWLLRDMRHPDGAFFAALDADSEGEEGKYYVWRRDQVKRLLDADEYLLVETLYGLDKPANFEGRWNLYRTDAWRSVVDRLSLDSGAARKLLDSARTKLAAERARRVPPALDDKVLTGWNGLVIVGLVRAGLRLDRSDWIDAAAGAADFAARHLFVDGTLYATFSGGRPRYPAYLDDHANLLMGLLELLQARWRDADVEMATRLADAAIERFCDTGSGGFFFTAHDHETLIHRPKPTLDDAQPPGNANMAAALNHLGHLLGDPRYLDVAARTLAWARPAMERYPAGHCSLLSALEDEVYPAEQVILRGPAGAFGPWLSACRAGYAPWRRVYAIPYDGVRTLPGYLPRIVSTERQQRVVAYRCSGLTCSAPIDDPETLAAQLSRP